MQDRGWIEEYVACYDVLDPSELQIEKAHLIKDTNLPERLFKFRAVNDFALQNLTDDTIWLNSPSRYNDPYDCAATISANEITDATFASLPEQLYEPLRAILSKDEITSARASADPFAKIVQMVLSRDGRFDAAAIQRMTEALHAATGDVLQPRLQQTIEQVRESIKMCSFSQRNDSILMWSHYAQNHTGFCMQYDVHLLDDLLRRLMFPVIYRRERFDVTKFHRRLTTDGSGFNNLFGVLQALYKAPEWAYEEEWRLVFGHGTLKEEQNIAFATPSRVYLGALIPDDHREAVTRICELRGIPVTRMTLSPTEYRMLSANAT